MADSKENIELDITDDWVLIEVDPDDDGYTEMTIEKITVERDTMWSTVNTLPMSGFLPYVARFDYDIYIKMTDDSTFKEHLYTITRF